MLPGCTPVPNDRGLLHETGLYLSKLNSAPPENVVLAADSLVRGLKTDGLWDKYDMIYLLKAHALQHTCINLRNPGYGTLTVSGTTTFTQNVSVAGNGSDGVMNAGIAYNALSRFQQNSCHLSAYIVGGTNAANSSKFAVSQATGTPVQRLCPRDAGGNFSVRLSSTTASNLGSSGGVVAAHWMAVRRGAAELEGYKNGASVGTDTDASTGVGSGSAQVTIFNNGADFSDFAMAAVTVGNGDFSDAQAADHHSRFAAYVGAF
jgi:hypothetical protein